MKNRMLIYLLVCAILGGIAGSFLTLGILQYKLEHDSGTLVKRIIIEQKDVIIEQLREEVEKEIDQMIQERKTQIVVEVQKMIEKEKGNLNQEIEKAIDHYIKMKVRNIFSN